MKQTTTLSIAVLALIGQTSAINLDKQVSADDFDGMGESTPVHSVAQKGWSIPGETGPPSYDENIDADMKAKGLAQKQPAIKHNVAQKHGFDSELEATENDLNMGMMEEKSLNGIEQQYTQRAPGIGGIDRADANMDKKDAEEAAKEEFKRKLNPVDGLLHNDDGTLTDPATGQIVESAGFNKKQKHHKDLKAPVLAVSNSTKSANSTLAQKSKSHKHKKAHAHHKKNKKKGENDDDTAETDKKAKDVAAVKAEAENNEKTRVATEAAAAKKAKDEADYKEKFSATDGLLHNKDGTKEDPTEQGKIISGVNQLAQDKTTSGHHSKHHLHAKHHHKSKKAKAEKEELTQDFEKKEHDVKKFAQWLEKDEPESENAAVQHHKHKGHHQKAGEHHKKIHHQHEKKHAAVAHSSLHQVDKEQHKHHEKKHHAKKHEGHHIKKEAKKAHHHKKEPVALQMNSTKMAEVNATSNVSKNLTLSANLTKNNTSNSTQNATAAIKQAVKK